MLSVTLFKQFLKEKASKNKESLSLYHYLCFFCGGDSLLKEPLIREFCQKALLFPYWQSRPVLLRKTLIEELSRCSHLYGPLGFDLKALAPIDQWQLVPMNHRVNRLKTVHLYLQSQKKTATQIKVLPLAEERTLGLVLEPSGTLKVLSFGPLFLIEQGKLQPLTSLSQLTYNAQYELASKTPQCLEIKDGHFINFQIQGRQVTGQGSQGFCFHLAEQFQQRSINELAFLFLPLKRLESLFIEPSSDPDYQELIRSLSQSYHKLLTNPYSADLKADLALFQARKALKNLYPQDPLLLLLSANIEYHLRKNRQVKETGIKTVSPV